VVRYVALGKESSFGTEASPTRYIDLARESFGTRHDWIIPELASARWPKYALKGPIRVEGSLDMYVRPDNIGEVLLAALGSVNTSQPDATNAPSVYLHEFTPADSLPSYTIHVVSEVTGRKFLGCVVRRLELTVAAGAELLGASLDVVGKEEQALTPGTPSFSTLPFFSFADLVEFLVGGSAVSIKALSVRIENDLVDDFYRLGDRKLPEIPVRGLTVEGSFDVKFEDRTHLDRFLNAEETSIKATFRGPEIEAGYYNELIIDLPRVVYTTAGANIDRREVMVEGVEFRALYDETAGYIVKISLQNAVSGY